MTTDSIIEVTHLVRTENPGVAAVLAVQRLVHAVAEWEPGACLDITFGSHDDKRVLALAQYGTEQPGWESDIKWAMKAIADVEAKRPGGFTGDRPDPTTVLEVTPTRNLAPKITSFEPPITDDEPHDPAKEARRRLTEVTPWPGPDYDSLRELAGLLAEQPGLLVRFRLAPADPLEIDILADALIGSWTREGGLYGYLGRPVRLRTLIASTAGPVPARMRALARRWATGLSIVAVDAAVALDVWDGPPDTLVGAAVPEGVALSVLRLPAAGDKPFPGMETRHPTAEAHPLDPVPDDPETPIRLGMARSVTGRPVDVTLDVRDLVRHGFIEGQSGAGKSTLIAALVRELTRNGYGCTLLDPHGSTIDQILRELPENSEKTYVVRHEDTAHPVPIDIITGDEEQVERVVDAFAEMIQMMYDPNHEGIVGPRWRGWFGMIARACYHALGNEASLVAITEAGSDVARVKQLALAIARTKPALAKTLFDEIVNNRSSEASELLGWCVSKLRPLVSTGAMRTILGTGHDAVDVADFVDNGRTLLIDLASPVLGEQSARMLGAIWLLKHQLAMGTRQRPDRPHIIIVDEAHLFQFGALPGLLAEGRKFGLGVIVATQFLGQLRTDLAESLQSNAGTFLTLRTGLPYAVKSSIRLADWPVGELVRLPNLTAAASISRDGTMTEPFTLTIDHHARMEESGARGADAEKRAESVAGRSRADLWVRFTGMKAMTPELLDQRLEERNASETSEYRVTLVSASSTAFLQVGRVLADYLKMTIDNYRTDAPQLPIVLADGVDKTLAYKMARAARRVEGVVIEVRPIKPPADPPEPERGKYLDEWLAKRKQQQEQDAAAATE